jgi:hypothetical protein
MSLATWFESNWLDLVQTVGIVGSLIISAQAARLDAKAQRASILFELTEHHREIWTEMLSRPELERVLEPKVDLQTNPPTKQEITFVKLLFLHLDSSFRVIRTKTFDEPRNLTLDIQTFLSLPIPRHVWEMTRPLRDPEFVAFVEKRLKTVSKAAVATA